MITWEIDSDGFLITDNNFVDMKSVIAVCKKDPSEIHLILNGGAALASLISNDDPEVAISVRNDIVEMLKTWMREYKRACKEDFQANENYKDALLAVQKSIIGTHIGVVK